jgi:hypothetical protein
MQHHFPMKMVQAFVPDMLGTINIPSFWRVLWDKKAMSRRMVHVDDVSSEMSPH